MVDSSMLFVDAVGATAPAVMLIKTFGAARSVSHALRIFIGLQDTSQIGCLACVFVLGMLMADAGARFVQMV